MAKNKSYGKFRKQAQKMEDFIDEAVARKLKAHEVELTLFQMALKLCYLLLKAYFDRSGDGDEGNVVEHDGQRLRRSKKKCKRRYRSLFGVIKLKRYVYAKRQGQKAEYRPFDARVGLPKSELSYPLQNWLQRLCVKESFLEGCKSLADLLFLKERPSAATAERVNQDIALHVPMFRDSRPVPRAEDCGELVVVTADGKGVPMRRQADADEGEGEGELPLNKEGEAKPKKRMAYAGAIYGIDRYQRTADDVLNELFSKKKKGKKKQKAPGEPNQKRPKPHQKHIRAYMSRTFRDEETGREWTSCGRTRLMLELAYERQQRDPEHKQPFICVMDGEAALWRLQEKWMSGAVGILDIFHVQERLWKVAKCLLGETTKKSKQKVEEWVKHQLRMLLTGRVGYVIGRLKRLLTTSKAKTKARKAIQGAITYFENNRQHMRYDQYLKEGYPIGSGVAEGTCRHLVNDRMERTGMSWEVEGAESMLQTRSAYINDEWEELMKYYIEQELHELYGYPLKA